MTQGARKPQPWYLPRKSRRPQRWALGIVVTLLVLALFSAHAGWKRLTSYPERPGLGSSDPISFTVPAGASFPQVLALLQEHEVIATDEAQAFKLFVLHRGAAAKITAGKHEFRGDMTPTQILDELMRRQGVQERRVTIPEGKQSLQIAQIFAEAGLGGSEQQLIAAMRDPALLAKLEISAPSAEGYLFPDTYKFSTEATAVQIVERMVKRHRQVYNEVRRANGEGARELSDSLGWGDEEILTMASLR